MSLITQQDKCCVFTAEQLRFLPAPQQQDLGSSLGRIFLLIKKLFWWGSWRLKSLLFAGHLCGVSVLGAEDFSLAGEPGSCCSAPCPRLGHFQLNRMRHRFPAAQVCPLSTPGTAVQLWDRVYVQCHVLVTSSFVLRRLLTLPESGVCSFFFSQRHVRIRLMFLLEVYALSSFKHEM